MSQMIEQKTGVYLIKNLINGKVYVGSAAKSFLSRWRVHRANLRHQTHTNTKLQNSWNKYGEAAFSFEVFIVCSPQNCLLFEQRVIDFLDAVNIGYNISPIAGSLRGFRHSDESKVKMSHAQKGKFIPLYMRMAVSKANSERVHSETTKSKLSNSLKGRIITPEWRENIRLGKLGRRVYNNGKISKLFKEDEVPEGFILGKLPKAPKLPGSNYQTD